MFYGFSLGRIWLFRRLIQQLFLWRLKIRDPEVVILGMDTEARDNDGANEREGVEPTYKGVEGFQPFQVTFGRFVADAILRGGSKHSNDGETASRKLSGPAPNQKDPEGPRGGGSNHRAHGRRVLRQENLPSLRGVGDRLHQ